MIKRDLYLQRLIDRMNNGSIKVITGIRRCGKSVLLFDIFADYLKSVGIDDAHILKYTLDNIKMRQFRDPEKLYDDITAKLSDQGKYYLFLDEIQFVDDFSELMNSLSQLKNVDTYVTGSNSRFLSSDILTEFRGRGDEVRVYPLSFSEFYLAKGGDKYEAWDEYHLYGGMPALFERNNNEQKSEYLKSLMSKVYLSDITDAFLFDSAKRYDVKGKKYFETPLKYYMADVGLRNARLNFRQIEENHIMENVIFNELKVRGYSVDVGVVESKETIDGKRKLKQLEIDFVANKGSKKYYIQSAYEMPTEEKLRQEKRSLIKVGDSFKKIVVVKENIRPQIDEEGIVTMGLINFLLDLNSLDL